MGQLCQRVSVTSSTLTLAITELSPKNSISSISIEMHFAEPVSIMIVTETRLNKRRESGREGGSP